MGTSSGTSLAALAGRSFDAVLFDMDGTLVDSRAAIARCWTAWAVEHGITADAFVRVDGHGRPAAEVVAELVPAERVAAATRRITELEVEDVEGVVRLPGAAEALAALPPQRWAVVTSCSRALAAARAAAAALPAPGAWVTVDDVRRGKPDPEPFVRGAQLLGADPARCLVVEDAPAGLRAARAAGCATLAVTTTHRAQELDADAVVATLAEVVLRVGAQGVELLPAHARAPRPSRPDGCEAAGAGPDGERWAPL